VQHALSLEGDASDVVDSHQSDDGFGEFDRVTREVHFAALLQVEDSAVGPLYEERKSGRQDRQTDRHERRQEGLIRRQTNLRVLEISARRRTDHNDYVIQDVEDLRDVRLCQGLSRVVQAAVDDVGLLDSVLQSNWYGILIKEALIQGKSHKAYF
jgi:hypothetical protein